METCEGDFDVKILLITANVGSLFEDPKRLLNIWLNELITNVTRIDPRFLALHLQEVGGKTYENSMGSVKDFIRCLCEEMAKFEFTYIRVYMDEDFKSAEYFTALGNIYFGHKDVYSLRLWNFFSHEWEDKLIEGTHIFSGNIESVSTKEKSKFPQNYFPECKWSRKGFMRTRWEINGTAVDLVNIHLFHDASNLAACENTPSVYCKTRRRALLHTIERFHVDDKNKSVPYFLFGDFNFRCDTAGVIKELTNTLTVHRIQNIKNECIKINYRNAEGNNILTVGKKEFSHADHQLKFKECWLKKFDKELEPLTEILIEYPINFIPSYPFEEDPEMPTDYMSTRCPAWCDRILMSPEVKDIIKCSKWKYDMIGETVCMGDHKPIYLTVHLMPNKGTYRSCDCNCTYTETYNKINLSEPIKLKHCPYKNEIFYNYLNEKSTYLNRGIMFKTLSLGLSYPFLLKHANSSSESDPKLIDTPLHLQNGCDIEISPSININLIDSDNMYVCTCTSANNSCCNDIEEKTVRKGITCPICDYVTRPYINSCHKLLPNNFGLSNHIVVNKLDTQYLNINNENSHVDHYTPESNESQSSYLNLSISNSVFPESYVDSYDTNYTRKQVNQNKSKDIYSLQSLTAISENRHKSTVTPVQLKSRLEDLQRKSIQASDNFANNNSDDINVEVMESQHLSNNTNCRIFSMCCSIH